MVARHGHRLGSLLDLGAHCMHVYIRSFKQRACEALSKGKAGTETPKSKSGGGIVLRARGPRASTALGHARAHSERARSTLNSDSGSDSDSEH